jgi:hypothetical protein
MHNKPFIIVVQSTQILAWLRTHDLLFLVPTRYLKTLGKGETSQSDKALSAFSHA